MTSSSGKPLSILSLKGLGWNWGRKLLEPSELEQDRLPYRSCAGEGTPLLSKDGAEVGRKGKLYPNYSSALFPGANRKLAGQKAQEIVHKAQNGAEKGGE